MGWKAICSPGCFPWSALENFSPVVAGKGRCGGWIPPSRCSALRVSFLTLRRGNGFGREMPFSWGGQLCSWRMPVGLKTISLGVGNDFHRERKSAAKWDQCRRIPRGAEVRGRAWNPHGRTPWEEQVREKPEVTAKEPPSPGISSQLPSPRRILWKSIAWKVCNRDLKCCRCEDCG